MISSTYNIMNSCFYTSLWCGQEAIRLDHYHFLVADPGVSRFPRKPSFEIDSILSVWILYRGVIEQSDRDSLIEQAVWLKCSNNSTVVLLAMCKKKDCWERRDEQLLCSLMTFFWSLTRTGLAFYKSRCVTLTRCIITLHFISSSSNIWQAKNNVWSTPACTALI